AHPEVKPVADLLAQMSERLCHVFRQQASADWRWFEPSLTYDNALLPLSLLRAQRITKDSASRSIAVEALEFLESVCFRNERLALIGNAGWHARGGARPESDEQPTDAAAFVLAFRGAFVATGNHHYLRRMRQ